MRGRRDKMRMRNRSRMLAARDKPGEAAYWRHSLARMSSLKEVVRLDDQEIWSVPNFHQDVMDDKKTGPYVEQAVGRYVPAAVEP